MLGKGEVGQRVAQVCAWHLNNGMSWEQLNVQEAHSADRSSRPYFTRKEIQAAKKVSSTAVELAKQRPQGKSSSTLSQKN